MGRRLMLLVLKAIVGISIASPALAVANPPRAPQTIMSKTESQKDAGLQQLDYSAATSIKVEREANRIAERANSIASQNLALAVWQILLSALAVTFTGLAAIFAWRATHWAKAAAGHAADAVEATRNALINVERPWLVLTEYEIAGPLTIGPDKFSVVGRFKVKNVGRTLALNAFFNTVVITRRTGSFEDVREQMQIEGLRTLEALQGHHGGMVLAPGDELEGGFGANFSAPDLEGSSTPVDPAIRPFVVGLVTYRSPNDSEPHQTGFTLIIQRTNRGQSVFDRPPILLTDGVIPLEELEITRFESGYTAT